MTATELDPVAAAPTDDDDPVRRGLRDGVTVAIGLAPFALAIGAAIQTTGLTAWEGVLGGAAILGGSAQLAGIDLVASGAAGVTVVVTIALINLRFALYSASFATWFRTEPLALRLAMATVLVDQNHALCHAAFATHLESRWRRHYYVSMSSVIVLVFFGGQVIGVAAGAVVPAAFGLHMAGPLVFAGLFAGAWRDRDDLLAGATAAVVVVAAAPLPSGLGLPLAIVVGATVTAQMGGRR